MRLETQRLIIRMMKGKKKKTILSAGTILGVILVCVFLFVYMAYVKGFYSASEKIVGEYTGLAELSFLGDKECYKIALNRFGQPIFEDPDAAFKQAAMDYEEAINLIYETFQAEYELKPFGKKNYQMYLTLGWQIPTGNEEIRRQGSNLTKFLDLYENSEKRWYLTPIGWVLE